MSYEELDKWIDTNAPGLNKRVLHTKVEESVSNNNLNSESQSLIIDVESVETVNDSIITTYDKTFQEIYDAYHAGQRIVLLSAPSAILVEIDEADDTQHVAFADPYLDSNNNYTLTWGIIPLSVNDDNGKLQKTTIQSLPIYDGGNTNNSN